MKRIIILLSLIIAMGFMLHAEQVTIGDNANEVRLISSAPGTAQIEFTMGVFNREAVEIDGQTWYLPSLKQGGLSLEAGLPEVPIMAGSLIIPPTAKMDLQILDSEYVDMQMPIAPSKGNLTRDIDPQSVPFSFSDFYQSDEAYPAQTVELSEPFILRDYRGVTVRFKPFVYYPETGITRVFTKIRVEIRENGVDMTNALSTAKNSYAPEFTSIYRNMFLNFSEAKYPSLDEEGRILVIKHAMFDAALQDYVDWKQQMGYDVSVVDVSVAGPSANQIKSYIQTQYDQNDGLMFVQIMGDAPQVPSLSYGGGGSDPSYALLAGNDSYPDIYVGRFSAQTVDEMQTQVARTVHYERDLQTDANWLQKAVGIASNEGGWGGGGDQGESDQEHVEIIRTKLLNYGYTTVDQLYQSTGATAGNVATSVNAGRAFINYTGHGSNTSWSTTGFNNTNVNNLVNDNMLPFIVSVACINGNFVNRTCFAEAWLRASNNGNPTGAIAMYASSVNQSWNPPMRGQDEITDLLVADAKHTIGGLFFNGSSKMIEVYGTNGADEYKNWHIFGDASLLARTTTPTEMTASYNPILLLGMNSMSVETEADAKLTLSSEGVIYGRATADAAGNAEITLDVAPMEPMDLTLTITARNKVTHLGEVEVLPADGPYLIITDVQVTDDSNSIPEFDEIVTVHFDLENVGNDPAEGITASIVAADPFITVIGEPELIDDIAAHSTGSTQMGIDIQISDFVSDQYTAIYTIEISVGSGEVFSYDQSLTINAPNIQWGNLLVDDSEGNQNGRIDPGESFVLSIPFENNGSSDCSQIQTSLIINGGQSLITPFVDSFDLLSVGEEATAVYSVTLSSQVSPGSTIQLVSMATYGGFIETKIYNIVVGIMVDGFENGFGDFPWAFTGGNWTIDTESYRGSYSAKSANISHNQSTAMSVTMSNPADGIISFWKKLSSEENHDYLKFYINGLLKNQWSGESDWTQVSYMVPGGTNTYRWEYVKDGSVSSGSDCVRIDEVVFPAETIETGAPIFTIDQTSLDFGNVTVGGQSALPILISNDGDAPMLGNIQVPRPFTLDPDSDSYVSNMSYVLDAGESLDLNVGFRPEEEGAFGAYLIINSDDPNAAETNVNLFGSATPVSTEDLVNPVITELVGNYPNPFNPATTIRFSLREKSPVSIQIYNITGQRVKTLVSSSLEAGFHDYSWNGDDLNGRPVASGIYFYKMQAGKYTDIRKMILMK